MFENIEFMAIQESELRLVKKAAGTDEVVFESILRPKTLSEYIGQSKIKNELGISIEASKKRKEPLEHILLYGPPGLGKTTLAMIVAREMGGNLVHTSGPAIEKQGDLAAILSSLQEGDVLFVDEIHRLRLPIEEVLYPAMEDFNLDLVMGSGPGARSMRLPLPKFTLIGATTKLASISPPLRDRFGHVYKLAFYEDDEMKDIVRRSAKVLGVDVEDDAAFEIGKRSRSTPRITNRLIKRVRDRAEVRDLKIVDIDIVQETLHTLGIDELGLDEIDRNILHTIADKFGGGPVGVKTLAASLSEEEATIEDVYEPFLIQKGLLDRTAQGRKITKIGAEYIGMPWVESQTGLFGKVA